MLGAIIVSLAFVTPIYIIVCIIKAGIDIKNAEKKSLCTGAEEPFIVSEYLARMEQATLDILEGEEPVDQTIILWWGLDGLRLNEDGSLEWISRRKPKSVSSGVFHQPCQSIQASDLSQLNFSQAQSTREQIDALMAQNTILQMQAAQNAAIISQIRPPLMPGYVGYPQYMQSALVPPLTQCWYNWPH